MKLMAVGSLKLIKLKRRFRLTKWQTVGLLESLWLFTQHNAPDGAIGRFSDEDIAAWIEWDGDASELVRALVETGWLDECLEHRLVVHDWAEHCPTYLKGAFHRNNKKFAVTSDKGDENDAAKHGAKHGAKHAAKHAAKEVAKDAARQGASLPNLVLPSLAKPGESCSEPSSTTTSEPSTADRQTIVTFPTVGDPSEWALSGSKLAEYQATFPDLDVLGSIRRARLWCVENRARRKTASGMPRFLYSWLERDQNAGRSSRDPPLAKPASNEVSRSEQLAELFRNGGDA